QEDCFQYAGRSPGKPPCQPKGWHRTSNAMARTEIDKFLSGLPGFASQTCEPVRVAAPSAAQPHFQSRHHRTFLPEVPTHQNSVRHQTSAADPRWPASPARRSWPGNILSGKMRWRKTAPWRVLSLEASENSSDSGANEPPGRLFSRTNALSYDAICRKE